VGGSITTTYVFGVYEQEGVIARKYYRFNGKPVAMREGASTVSYLHSDHLGSASAATNSSGVLTSWQRFDPWGKVRASANTMPTKKNFTGQYLDDTGLLYYNARYYDPNTARFISADTVVPSMANPQEFNRYSYVRNNPLRYTDPSGHCAIPEYTLSGACPGEGDSWVSGGRVGSGGGSSSLNVNVGEAAVVAAAGAAAGTAGAHRTMDPATGSVGGSGEFAGVSSDTGGQTASPNPDPDPDDPGKWERVDEYMSDRARDYQTQITGRTGEVYRVNGVKFDGYNSSTKTLLDAKGPGYAKFVENGAFKS
jgi:RHS repeat-associated protein